jgi:WD40 repeat protein/tRNA A-37 threonylcarbamoyl transferase component Bud32
MAETSQKVEEIYYEALQRKAGFERVSYLDTACGHDSGLRSRLESLLKANDEAGDFLETPAIEIDDTLDRTPIVEGPGCMIGPYKLLEKIGEGGMAVVYMAEQQSPVRRRVALKIIKLGMDTHQVIARFEAERQALAVMEHPNIAKVFDAGATETGRPYFVMELVRGVSITEHCDRNKLTTQERLELFVPVCNAVHHAHTKGIIHRDIKPSNIMVTLHDGVPVPMVIDFGIAKATNQRLTERTVFTRYAELIGTPEYMSPEQAEMSALDIDTRTDIYSLGGVLYELLTGVLPFDEETLRSAALGEIQRIIREVEPPRPSTRLSALGERARKIAESRRTDHVALAKRLRSELEWIPLKALRKDRTRRYRSASELADDVQNYLEGRPLIAGPESAAYRLRKFVSRSKGTVFAATTVLSSLVVGLVVSTTMYFTAERERDLAQNQMEGNRRLAYRQSIQRIYADYQLGHAGNIRTLLEDCPSDLRGWEWNYLWHISDESSQTLAGHAHMVPCVVFGPDGRYIASGSLDKTIKIWNGETGTEIKTLHADAWVYCLSFSPDGRYLVSGDSAAKIKIWESHSGHQIMNVERGEIGVSALAYSPNGQQIAYRAASGEFGVLNIHTGEDSFAFRIPGGRKPPRMVRFSSDGKWILTDGSQGEIQIVDATKGNVHRIIRDSNGTHMKTALFTQDGKNVVSGDSAGAIRKWDIDRGTELMSIRAHRGQIISLSCPPDGTILASGGLDGLVKIWSMPGGAELGVLNGHARDVMSVAFHPDGRRVVSTDSAGAIKLWVTDGDRERRVLQCHEGLVRCMTFSPDSRFVASCGIWDSRITIWETKTGAAVSELAGHEEPVCSVAYSPDGQSIVTGSDDTTVRIWESETGKHITTLSGHSDTVWSVAFTPDGKRVVSGGADKTIRVWDAATRAEMLTLRGHEEAICSISVSPDGTRVASSSVDGTARLWDLCNGKEVDLLRKHNGWIECIAFSPDGKQIICVGCTLKDGVSVGPLAELWNLNRREEVLTLHGHCGGITNVDFSPDGRRIVTASLDDTVRVWDASTGFEIMAMTLGGSELAVDGPLVAFSPDGMTVAATDMDKIVFFESAK